MGNRLFNDVKFLVLHRVLLGRHPEHLFKLLGVVFRIVPSQFVCDLNDLMRIEKVSRIQHLVFVMVRDERGIIILLTFCRCSCAKSPRFP